MSAYKYDEAEPYRQRIRDLEAQLQRMDVRFSNILTHTGKGADIEQFIRESNELHIELEKVTKQMMQKRNEAELWKQKYEQQLSLTMQIRNNYELELQQLSKEVQRLLDKIDQFEYEKRRQDNQQQRESLQDKDLEIDDLINKLQRMRQEHENETQRLLNDNENLRHKMNQIELDRQKELEQMRFKIETFHSQNIDNLRKTHQSQLSVVESEIDKLRGLLEIKNSEIETLLQQNLKMKVTYENQISEVTAQYDAQKQKIQKQELLHRDQLTQLQAQLIDESKLSMTSLSKNYEQSILTLEKECKNYQIKNDVQAKEILSLQAEKQQLRDNLERQLDQLRKDNDILKQRSSQQEQTKNQDLQQMEQELIYTKKILSESDSHYKQQISNLENDLRTLQERETLKCKDVDSQIQQFILIKQALEEDLQHLRLQNQNLVEQIAELEKLVQFESEEWKVKLQQNETALKERIKILEAKNDQLVQESRKQRELIDSQIKQIPEKEFKALIEEIETLKTKQMIQEREKLKDREDLRVKLEQSNRYQIDNLKTAFNTQIKILDQENQDLKSIINQKENTIQELLLKYQNLERAYSGQAIGPQEQASKNIYQAYIRSTNRQSSMKKQ